MRAVMLGTLFALALLLAPAAARASPLPCTQISDEGAPVTLAALLAAGDAALRAALEALEPQDDLLAARACYERALQQSPDSYAASLGLGVGEVLRAQHLGRSRQDAADAIGQAKLHLGRAYFLRQDPYEPLYYLAEVALLEGDLAQAIAAARLGQQRVARRVPGGRDEDVVRAAEQHVHGGRRVRRGGRRLRRHWRRGRTDLYRRHPVRGPQARLRMACGIGNRIPRW